MISKIKNISAVGWVIFAAFNFALMGAFAHELSEMFHWTIIAFVRTFFNYVFVLVLAIWTKKELLYFKAPKSLWIRSLAGAGAIFASFYTFSYLPVAEATTVLNITPIWMVLLVAVVIKERVPVKVWIAVMLGIVGVAFVQQPHFKDGNIAVFVGILSAFFASIALYSLYLVKGVHSTTIVAHYSLVGSILTFIVMLPFGGDLFDAFRYSPKMIIALIGVGASGTVAQLALTRAYLLGNPTVNATVGLAQVAFAAGLDILIWNREFNTVTVIGIILVTIPTTFFIARMPFRAKAKSA